MLNWPLFLLRHVVLNLVRQMYDSQTLFDTGRRNSEAVSRKRWFREISDWIWVHHITCLFFFADISQKHCTLQFLCVSSFSLITGCVEVSADIEPLEYTPKPECPPWIRWSVAFQHQGDSYDFMGWRTKSCASLNAWNTGFNSITFTWSSSMDHATYAIMMKWFYRMDVSGLRQMQLMTVLGSLAKWWRQTIKTWSIHFGLKYSKGPGDVPLKGALCVECLYQMPSFSSMVTMETFTQILWQVRRSVSDLQRRRWGTVGADSDRIKVRYVDKFQEMASKKRFVVDEWQNWIALPCLLDLTTIRVSIFVGALWGLAMFMFDLSFLFLWPVANISHPNNQHLVRVEMQM